MAKATDKAASIRQNLADAGLDDAEIAECIELICENRCSELGKLLAEHRRSLLDNVHKYNARIDCLDYFTYTMKKNGGI